MLTRMSARDDTAPVTLHLDRVPGVLGRIVHERAADYAAADSALGGARARTHRFETALRQPGLSLIAEVKRASPSQGGQVPVLNRLHGAVVGDGHVRLQGRRRGDGGAAQAEWPGYAMPDQGLVVRLAGPVDQRLAEQDIRGSLAHVTMLGAQGILTADEVKRITDGLNAVLADGLEGIRDRVAFEQRRDDAGRPRYPGLPQPGQQRVDLVVSGVQRVREPHPAQSRGLLRRRGGLGALAVVLLAAAFALASPPAIWPLARGLGGLWGEAALGGLTSLIGLTGVEGARLIAAAVTAVLGGATLALALGVTLVDVRGMTAAFRRRPEAPEADVPPLAVQPAAARKPKPRPSPPAAAEAEFTADAPEDEDADLPPFDVDGPALDPKVVANAPRAPKPSAREARESQAAFEFAEEEGFRLPELAMLAKPQPRQATIDESALKQNARLLESVLAEFGVTMIGATADAIDKAGDRRRFDVAMKKIGLDTGRAVLAVKKDDIVRRTELEEETVDDVYRIIRQEFADDEDLDDSALEAAKKNVAASKAAANADDAGADVATPAAQ